MSVELIRKYVGRNQQAIKLAMELNRGALTRESGIMNIAGMCSAKTRLLMHRLVENDARYLEVGTFLGATFCAALYQKTPAYACAIDNFSEFAEVGNSAEDFKKNCDKFLTCNYDFFNRDCFNLTKSQKSKIKNIDVYLYDGPHTQEDHIKAITYYYENLADVFTIIVDDWNMPEVRRGTFMGFKEKNIAVDWQISLPSNGNGDRENFWNGSYVAVCHKRRQIEVE